MSRRSHIDAARNAMVDDLVRRHIVRTPAVERVLRTVPRHEFLPRPFRLAVDDLATDFEETDDPRRVYSDAAVGLNPAAGGLCSAPSIVAGQLEQLGVAEGMRVLHVGTGSGYCTALLADLAGDRGTVVGVEYNRACAEQSAALLAKAGYTNVTVRSGDGALGVPEAAPFDRILVSVGVADIAPAWIAQLYDDGRLVLPLCQPGRLDAPLSGGVLLAVHKIGDQLWGELSTTAAFFAPLRGDSAPTEAEGTALADALQRWFALEDFLRAEQLIRIAMKADLTRPPRPDSLPWLLETRSAVMWIEPS